MNWRDELLSQLDFYWEHSLWPRLAGLTDAEYFWEPVADCWSIRAQPDGTYLIDWKFPVPEPPPVTTIAWRLAHIAVQVFGIRASAHFGDGSLTLQTANWPASAAEAVDMLETNYSWWRDGVRTLDDAGLGKPVGQAEGPWSEYPYATLVLHLNREVMHHGAEIALLRDLYRAEYGTT
ncbi:DinB family protein [Tamaricihabitans halophyticus]|uniref:DinB family protein n=1 Tax=Tamaricihabitans halophyticus TaxID=1262583 RepID=A0A4R2R0Z5_9PSEU|nr:DinB family protein [Tamaricihabitans halophyticus]TCP56153.1 DinB family protein [Tamaricihabitans halophyticus]